MSRQIFTKIYKKCAIALILAAAFFAMPAFQTYVHADGPITTRPAPRRPAAMGLEITGEIPRANFDCDELNELLNDRFTAQFNSFVVSHQASALSVDFQPQIFHSPALGGNPALVSVVVTMTATSATTTSAVATTVLNYNTGDIITLDQYNVNAISLVNNRIRAIIGANPRGFVSNFSGIDGSHPFYIANGRLVIPFGSAELVPTARDIQHVELSIENIRNITINRAQVNILPPEQYSTRMVRLSTVLSHFDYEYNWNPRTLTIDIAKDGHGVASLTIDVNSFSYRRSTERELEASPMLRQGRTYVPISFFDEIMGMSASITPGGNIIISRYMAPLPDETPAPNLEHLR